MIYVNFIITEIIVSEKNIGGIIFVPPFVFSDSFISVATCSLRITGYNLQKIPRQSTKCHYMTLRLAFGVLRMKLETGVWCAVNETRLLAPFLLRP